MERKKEIHDLYHDIHGFKIKLMCHSLEMSISSTVSGGVLISHYELHTES